ncbi:MAG: signal recognition particle receptor subunit alpha, partial [Candidatus Diapherotrites archaeon]|nr:signal recognition particle receptor subunit alpha [Candidatus Diapherotrites archaeon]
MAFGDQLRDAFEQLRKSTFSDKDEIKQVVKNIQRALISADVPVTLVLELSKKIEAAAFSDLPEGLNRREHVTKIAYDALAEILGGTMTPPKDPKRILLVGLFGQGKSTQAGKLAHYYQKRGKKVGLIAADTFRPAAMEQLQQIADKIKVPVFLEKGQSKPEKIIATALKNEKEFDLLICDSAGRSGLDSELTKEIKEIDHAFAPDQTWLVLGADLGQIAATQAAAFHDAVGVNGVIVTRMDGSAKGGGTLAACHQTKAPVYFIGVGEKMGDLEEFDAVRFLSRVMGYGDLQALLEKAKEATEDGELDLEAMLHEEYTLETFFQQLEATKKIGSMDKIMEMMGMKQQIPKELAAQSEQKLGQYRFIMQSMTKKEKREPELINSSRIARIGR